MKPVFPLLFLLLVIVLASCAPATSTPLPPVVLEINDSTATNEVRASAEVVPAQETHLSFVIPGIIKEVTVKEGDQVKAGQVLVMLDTKELELAVVAAEAALTSAEIDAKMQRYRRKQFNFNTGNFVYTSGPREKILVADAKVAQMQAALESARALLDQGFLAAPTSGTVVTLNASEGEYVRPAQQVIAIVDLNTLQIETTDLSELNITEIKVGQPAMVFIEALDEEFPGKVTAISPISGTLGGDVVFTVTIQLDKQPASLLWGMSADVEISIE